MLSKKMLIIGAGIGGLTAAIALSIFHDAELFNVKAIREDYTIIGGVPVNCSYLL